MGRGSYCAGCGATHARDQAYCHSCGRAIGADEPPDPWIGASLGRYEIERVVAAGGMGVVYAARDPQLGRTVALKLLRADLAADDEFRRRFVRESRSAAALDHPNILPVFDAGEVDGVLYIATRLVNARDLRQMLSDEGHLTLEQALAITAQVAAALDFAHERGTVHRDVKPANILVVPGSDGDPDHAYLIDFGITKLANHDNTLTGSGMFVGTPEYGAPEQATGGRLDGRADQYALACVLHHCLAGEPPFTALNAVDVLHAHIYAEPPPIGAIWPEAPASIEHALLRALSKQPEQRFATCRAFIAAARSDTGLPGPLTPPPRETIAITRRPAKALAPSAPPRSTPARGGHRDRRLAIAAVVVVLLAAAGAAAGALLGGGSDPQTTVAYTTKTVVRDGQTQTVTVATTTTTPADVPLSVEDLDLTEREQDGYALDLPRDWDLVRDDEDQVTAPGVTRRRTEAASADLGVSIVVDHLTGFELTPARNRDALIAQNGRRPGYRTVARSQYDVNGTTAYEYRFRFLSATGVEARRVNVLLRRGKSDFGVLVGGTASFEDLAELAQATAESIVVTPSDEVVHNPPPPPDEPAPVEPPEAVEPSSGLYEGVLDQRGSTEDDFTVRMQFDGVDGDTVDYPDNGCHGSLELDSRDDHAVFYTETIEGPCARGGRWRVVVGADSTLMVKWTAPGKGYSIAGKLVR